MSPLRTKRAFKIECCPCDAFPTVVSKRDAQTDRLARLAQVNLVLSLVDNRQPIVWQWDRRGVEQSRVATIAAVRGTRPGPILRRSDKSGADWIAFHIPKGDQQMLVGLHWNRFVSCAICHRCVCVIVSQCMN